MRLLLIRGKKVIIVKSQLVEQPEQFKEPLVVVEAAADGFQVTRRNAGAGDPLRLRGSDVEPWGMKVYYWSFTGHGFVECIGIEDSRDADAFMRARYGCTEGPILTVARGGADELVVVLLKPVHTNLPWSRHQGFGSSIDAVDQVVPGFATSARTVAALAKRDLLGKVSPINMLSEQEKQIDLLSMLVVELAEKQPESERPDWLPAFKAMLEQHSSVQFKGAAGALADVAVRKAGMRELQRAYFAKREAGN